MTLIATGRLGEPGWVVFTRTFTAPVEDVWAAVTEPDRLERWIGTWTGNPAAGSVRFRMTAEGDDVPEQLFAIDECRPPYSLEVTSTDADGSSWRLRLVLSRDGQVTTLRFGQHLTDPDLASSVGPGWDYYLDRLVAAEAGNDLSAVDFDDYYPALSEHYRSLLSTPGS
jgi:uncharacterized protein YndB with AHSA1/START domain